MGALSNAKMFYCNLKMQYGAPNEYFLTRSHFTGALNRPYTYVPFLPHDTVPAAAPVDQLAAYTPYFLLGVGHYDRCGVERSRGRRVVVQVSVVTASGRGRHDVGHDVLGVGCIML